MIKRIDIDELTELARRGDVQVVDARPMAAYNGWRLDGEPRGGHIPGAVAFPHSWALKVRDANLVHRLENKGLDPKGPIVVYGSGQGEARSLARRLGELGYRDVSILRGGFADWAARPDVEVKSLPKFERLVPPRWLHRLLHGKAVAEVPEGRFAVYHVNYGVPEEYAKGHIPGAFHLDTNSLESSKDWNRRSPEELEAALRDLGISRHTTVIVYGRDSAMDPSEQKPGRIAGQIAATRAAAILLYAGVEDVRLLDGGFNAWIAQGYGVETEPNVPEPVTDFGAAIPAVPDYFIDYDEAVELIEDPDGELVSIRSAAEHRGQTSGYNYIEELGDIPGAVWANCGTDAYHMQHYRNVDNTMRDFNEIASNWEKLGIVPDKKVAFYCGTGWRASETFFYAYLMDWPQASVYDGGWFEWTRRAGNGGTS